MKWLKRAGILLAVMLTTGCLSDSDSTAGIEGTGSPATVSGTVTAYGSIYVNGVHIDIDSARVFVDGQPMAPEDIALGMVVEVDLSQLDGRKAVAEQVRYRRALRGPVDELVVNGDVRRELRILGQRVEVYEDIQFDGVSFDSLASGETVEISGLVETDGSWRATRVASAVGGLAARGQLTELADRRQRFRLGTQWVDASQATIEGRLADGQWVAVSGGERRGEYWYPERVDVLALATPRDGAPWINEGVIERVTSSARFELSGVLVDASAIEGVATLDLKAGVRVVVRGRYRGGEVRADDVQVVRPGTYRVRAPIDDIDPDTSSLVLLGQRFQLTDLTTFENPAGSSQPRQGLSLNQLRVGQWLDVYIYDRGDAWVATRVRRQRGAVDTLLLQGPLTALDSANAMLSIMGVAVSVQTANGAEQLDELQLGDLVSVTGDSAGSYIEAQTLSRRALPDDLRRCPSSLGRGCPRPLAAPSLVPQERLRFRF